MKIGNVTKAATIKIFPQLNYKNIQLLIFVTVFFKYFHETNTNRCFCGLHKNKNCAFPLTTSGIT